MLPAKAIALCCALTSIVAGGVPAPTAREISDQLAHLSVDANQIYHVRDVRLNRGGVKIYLNDGILAFAKPVEGKVVAAVFTTRGIEAGDAEVLAFPPNRSERTSLASYTKSPNLNDHFGTAVFFFTDSTVQDLLKQLPDPPGQKAPELAETLLPAANPILNNLYPNFDLNLVDALLDQHQPEEGFFFGTFSGRDLGPFSFLFEPTNPESVSLGQINVKENRFRLWTSYASTHAPPQLSLTSRFSDYAIHAKIAEDLTLSATAEFTYRCDDTDGRSLRFDLSDRLHVTGARIDQETAEFFGQKPGSFLVVAPKPLSPGTHRISVTYAGGVIRRTTTRTYFVEARNTWYPRSGTTAAVFDLTFECPASLQLVSTGELISNSVDKGIRSVHRRTLVPENIAGFNLGDYRVTRTNSRPYRVDVFYNRSGESDEDLGPRAASILQKYSGWWSILPSTSLSVSPISGYFGQGFPGLIYLSDVTYEKPENRPANLRTPRMESFFSNMLLPHEVAHQWWGNLVLPADYRTGWLTEAMATHSALEYLADNNGEEARASVLAEYRKDLVRSHDGKVVESLGPVDFGVRLIDIGGTEVWHTIAYEKGAWVLRMLQLRLGEQRWRQVQLALLREFTSRPLTNDALRNVAARYLPPDQPDKELQVFFETWVYSTGIPRLALQKYSRGWQLDVSNVTDDFTVDVPVSCHSKSGRDENVRWVRAVAGENALPATENSKVCSLPRQDRFLYTE